jgi:hypothetical protein
VKLAHLVASGVSLGLSLGLLLTLPAAAHTPQQPPHQSYSEGDLRLESGEAIKDFSISYVTYGTLNAKKSNAILMVTAISGNHHRLDFMIGPDKALDPCGRGVSQPRGGGVLGWRDGGREEAGLVVTHCAAP